MLLLLFLLSVCVVVVLVRGVSPLLTSSPLCCSCRLTVTFPECLQSRVDVDVRDCGVGW